MRRDRARGCDMEFVITSVSSFEVSLLVAMVCDSIRHCRRSEFGFVYCVEVSYVLECDIERRFFLIRFCFRRNQHSKCDWLDACFGGSWGCSDVDCLVV